MIWFYANSRCANIVKDEDITSGSVGLEVGFSLSTEWEGLAKVAVFRAADVSVDVYLSEDQCTVPPEVLTIPGEVLTIGLYGTDGSRDLVIPTVYANAGPIVRGTTPSGIEPTPHTASLAEQLLAAAQAARDAAAEAERLAKSLRDDADAGEFDGAPGEPGAPGVSPTVQITHIEGGHRVTITDAEHPTGQSFDVMDGSGGGGSGVDLDDTLSQPGKAADAAAVGTALEKKGTYSKPSGGIPKTDLASAVQTSLGKADEAYKKPSGGIPKSDLASAVQTSLGKADAAYKKPSGGIPASDLAQGVIPTVPTKTSDLTNDSGYQTATQVEAAIDNHLSAVYKAAGTVASISALPAPSAAYLGYVYNVEAAFTTTADFAEGAGIDYPAGTDVAIIAVQSGGSTTYKYDALSGFVDLSGYIAKPSTASSGQFLVYNGSTWVAQTVPAAESNSFGGGS